MALNGAAAAAYMSPGRANEVSACLYTVWLAYGSPHTVGSLAGHTFPTAIDAWNYTTKRHYDRNPPEGASVWFGACSGPRYSGDAHWRDGDVTVARKRAMLGATDYPAYGRIGECTIAQREAQTGRAYLGWTSDFIGNDIQLESAAGGNATPITNTTTPATPGRKKEDTMTFVCVDEQVVDVPGKAGVRNATYKTRRLWVWFGEFFYKEFTASQATANGFAGQMGNAVPVSRAFLNSIQASQADARNKLAAAIAAAIKK